MNHRMMSDEHNIVGRWPSNHQWQFPADLSPHHQQQQSISTTLSSHVQNLVPHHNMSNYKVAELSWENGQPAIQGIFSAKPTWERSSSSHDTLESIVHQAKSLNHKTNMINSHDQRQEEAFAGNVEIAASLSKKRPRSETTTLDDCGGRCSIKSRWVHDHGNVAAAGECSGYGSGGATFRKGNETDYTSSSMRGASWVSLDSPRSLITKTSFEDSACRKNREERQETEEGTIRSHGTRRRRFADIHNESERRRRDRINQKLKALQKLVPNASKSDKASMLDEVIEYLKRLQVQVQMMSSRFIPQLMMNPLAMQHLLQMSLLSGIGMGILDPNARLPSTPQTTPMGSTPPTFLSPPALVVPPVVPPCQPLRATNSDASMNSHPYATYFGQHPRECGFLPEDGKSQWTSGC